MEKTLSRSLSELVAVTDVIEDLRRRAPSLKPNSYYLYRAVILQELRDWFEEGTLSEEEAWRLVDRMAPEKGTRSIGERVQEVRTSAKRRQHARPATFAALIDAARSRSHPTFDNLAGILEFGLKVGTRPLLALFGAQRFRCYGIGAVWPKETAERRWF
jgi:hypothetical protein